MLPHLLLLYYYWNMPRINSETRQLPWEIFQFSILNFFSLKSSSSIRHKKIRRQTSETLTESRYFYRSGKHTFLWLNVMDMYLLLQAPGNIFFCYCKIKVMSTKIVQKNQCFTRRRVGEALGKCVLKLLWNCCMTQTEAWLEKYPVSSWKIKYFLCWG